MYKSYERIIHLLFLIFLLSSCVEEYWPELKELHESILVVEGRITNLSGPYTIKLSQAITLQDSVVSPMVGASVKILDNEGNYEPLLEEKPGEYKTINQDFIGIVGRSYKVEIITSEGEQYASEYEELIAVVPIEDVTFKEIDKTVDEVLGTIAKGYQFYVTSALSESPWNFFYWELEESYEYHADYKIMWYYFGVKDLNSDGPEFAPRATDFHKSLHVCWKTSLVSEFFSSGTIHFLDSKADNIPLHFIEYSNDKLEYGYSLLVRQYSISEQAHFFLMGLNQQNTPQYNLYTKPPYQVKGNIININDPREPTLGYFMVAGASEPKRIFTKRPYIYLGTPSYEITCGEYAYNSTFAPNTLKKLINSRTHSSAPLYFSIVTVLAEAPDGQDVRLRVIAYLDDECVDCRTKGGTTTKPDFWIDF